MTTLRSSGRPARLLVTSDPATGGNRRFRIRRSITVVLVALSTAVGACTPGEIEQTIGLLSQSFEDAGLEGALSRAIWIAPEVEMRIRMRLGNPGF